MEQRVPSHLLETLKRSGSAGDEAQTFEGQAHETTQMSTSDLDLSNRLKANNASGFASPPQATSNASWQKSPAPGLPLASDSEPLTCLTPGGQPEMKKKLSLEYKRVNALLRNYESHRDVKR